ncbi:MAG: AraC family transcriptional regulator [Clostridia bacterium]|nr:AraC family transcriptional regulator [Clostridia bacterium]
MEQPKFEKSVSFAQAHIVPGKYRNLKNIPHWHEEHELVFVQSGCAAVMCSGEIFPLSAGDSTFLHSEDVHSISAEPGAILLVAKIDADYLHKIIGAKKLCSPLLARDYALGDVFAELFAEIKAADAYSGIIADSIVTRLAAQIFRGERLEDAESAPNATTEKYKELLDLIAKNYAYITFDDAAEFMHFSKPYFSRFFYHHAGMTFTRYLNMIKISYAAQMVIEGSMTVTEISQRCGFNTIRNFNRVFKEMTGYSPHALPANYNFVCKVKEYTDSGFDPTLSCTEILEP